jgi:hypothetical protein
LLLVRVISEPAPAGRRQIVSYITVPNPACAHCMVYNL